MGIWLGLNRCFGEAMKAGENRMLTAERARKRHCSGWIEPEQLRVQDGNIA